MCVCIIAGLWLAHPAVGGGIVRNGALLWRIGAHCFRFSATRGQWLLALSSAQLSPAMHQCCSQIWQPEAGAQHQFDCSGNPLEYLGLHFPQLQDHRSWTGQGSISQLISSAYNTHYNFLYFETHHFSSVMFSLVLGAIILLFFAKNEFKIILLLIFSSIWFFLCFLKKYH